MDTLQGYPYPMTAAQLAESTEIPYTTISRRLAVLVAEGSLAIDSISGSNGRTMFYKLSGRPPSIKWMKGGTDKPENVTLTQAIELIKQFPAVGAIDKAIEDVLIDFVEGMQSDTLSIEVLAVLKRRLESLSTMLTDRVAVITSIQSSPMWTIRAVEAIKGSRLSF